MPFVVPAVTKPFADYKWRWMEVTPVESFNRVDLLLGVTRAIQVCEGDTSSSAKFNAALAQVQVDLLPRASDPQITSSDRSRNVLRRQGRYWRGLGLLSTDSTKGLRLTPYGRRFAQGQVTPDGFVRDTIASHELPNLAIDSVDTVAKWRAAGLSIAPLKVLLAIMAELGKVATTAAFLTTDEIARVVVPLCLHSTDPSFLADAVREFRVAPGKFAGLPNCAPGSNDRRMLREHLLFLQAGRVVKSAGGSTNATEKFYLGRDALEVTLQTKPASPNSPSTVTVEMVEQAIDVIMTVEREKRVVEVVARPAQSKFRQDVLKACGASCVITGETVSDVLIACHIHEVWEKGSDHSSNGIMLRADLHVLFDNHKLRIGAAGDIVLAPDVAASPTYAALPKSAKLPAGLNKEALRRRFLYGKVST